MTTALEEQREDVINFFSQEETGNDGIAVRFDNILDSYLSSSTGLIASKEEGLQVSIKTVGDQVERISYRLEKREEILRSQFESLELLLSGFQATSSALEQQLQNLTNLSNSIYGKK